MPGPAPEYVVRATFALFEDGTWAGDERRAHAEIAALREEYAAARAIGELLAAVPDTPPRPAVERLASQLSRGLAVAASARVRILYQTVLTTRAVALDDEARGDRLLAQMVGIARDKIDRRLAAFEPLAFLEAPTGRRDE